MEQKLKSAFRAELPDEKSTPKNLWLFLDRKPPLWSKTVISPPPKKNFFSNTTVRYLCFTPTVQSPPPLHLGYEFVSERNRYSAIELKILLKGHGTELIV
jgi:hypothetical protein